MSTISNTNQVSVAATPTLIIAAKTNNSLRQSVIIYNPSASVTVYVGGSNVTVGNGHGIAPGQSLSLPVTSGAVYGIVTSSTQTVSFIEIV